MSTNHCHLLFPTRCHCVWLVFLAVVEMLLDIHFVLLHVGIDPMLLFMAGLFGGRGGGRVPMGMGMGPSGPFIFMGGGGRGPPMGFMGERGRPGGSGYSRRCVCPCYLVSGSHRL